MSGARSRGASNPVSRREGITTRHPSTRPKTATPLKPTESYELKENPVHSNSRRVTTTESRPTTSASTSQTQGSIQPKSKPKKPESDTRQSLPRTPKVQDSSLEGGYLRTLANLINICDKNIEYARKKIKEYKKDREEEFEERPRPNVINNLDQVIKRNESRFLLVYALRERLKCVQLEIGETPRDSNFDKQCSDNLKKADEDFKSIFEILGDGDAAIRRAESKEISKYLKYA